MKKSHIIILITAIVLIFIPAFFFAFQSNVNRTELTLKKEIEFINEDYCHNYCSGVGITQSFTDICLMRCLEGTMPMTKDECIRAKGRWMTFPAIYKGYDGHCAVPTTDRGTNCSDGDECQGSCSVNLTTEELREARKSDVYLRTGEFEISKDGTCSEYIWPCDERIVEEGRVITQPCID